MNIFSRDSFWQKLSILAGLFLLMAIFSMVFLTANIEIKDFDLWLHLGMGRYIWNNGFHIPTTDILSCSIAGKPWNTLSPFGIFYMPIRMLSRYDRCGLMSAVG